MSDLSALKALSKARETEEKRVQERRRCVLVLILRHLADHGYSESYERLCTESNLSLQKVDVADNMDLLRILQDFEEYWETKFGKRPKLVKRSADEGMPPVSNAMRPRGSSSNGNIPPLPPAAGSSPAGSSAANGGSSPNLQPTPSRRPGALEGPPIGGAMAARQRRATGQDALQGAEEARRAEQLERRQNALNSVRPPTELGGQRIAGVAMDGRGAVLQGMSREEVNAMQVQGLAAARQGLAAHAPPRGEGAGGGGSDDESPDEFFERRMLKPLPASLQGELRELGAALQRDIFTESPNVRWESISGLETAKRLLKEAVVAPIRFPQLFTGLLTPWKGVLLYGPPGTGKTMLAKAVATECKTTFFNISASSIISKWRGDSEKLVRVLFELARHHAPSTIFLDELDALMAARGGEGEHEASRRMKTELLIQMDGLARGSELVFVLAATNLPWELDMAMLRRLEKRILVPLPDTGARRVMFDMLLAGRCAPDVTMDSLAEKTAGFSGSDVTLLAKEAAMRPLRRLLSRLDIAGPASGEGKGGSAAAVVPELGPITVEDVAAAVSVSRSSAGVHEARYQKFSDEYGQIA